MADKSASLNKTHPVNPSDFQVQEIFYIPKCTPGLDKIWVHKLDTPTDPGETASILNFLPAFVYDQSPGRPNKSVYEVSRSRLNANDEHLATWTSLTHGPATLELDQETAPVIIDYTFEGIMADWANFMPRPSEERAAETYAHHDHFFGWRPVEHLDPDNMTLLRRVKPEHTTRPNSAQEQDQSVVVGMFIPHQPLGSDSTAGYRIVLDVSGNRTRAEIKENVQVTVDPCVAITAALTAFFKFTKRREIQAAAGIR